MRKRTDDEGWRHSRCQTHLTESFACPMAFFTEGYVRETNAQEEILQWVVLEGSGSAIQ
jgi:hypothetical protein